MLQTYCERSLKKPFVSSVDKVFHLKTGIGTIPDSSLAELKHHKDLGIHSEMFSDGVVDLVETGAITNEKKNILPGRIVGSFVIGTDKVFEFIDNNPFVGKYGGDDVTLI